jgi:hypothetical protein
MSISKDIVVDSPPGITKPSILSSSDDTFTGTDSIPSLEKVW